LTRAHAGAIHRNTGHPPPVIDTLLAATALENDLCLVTKNAKDVDATDAEVFNPWGTS
jgi:toxin FitB